MPNHKYVCDMCHGEFEATDGWTDEMALAEARENGHLLPPNEMAEVCDDCYRILEEAYAPDGKWPQVIGEA